MPLEGSRDEWESVNTNEESSELLDNSPISYNTATHLGLKSDIQDSNITLEPPPPPQGISGEAHSVSDITASTAVISLHEGVKHTTASTSGLSPQQPSITEPSPNSSNAVVLASPSTEAIRELESVMDNIMVEKKMLICDGEVRSMSFSPDGRTLACAASKGIMIWDVPRGIRKQTLAAHTDWIRCLAFSPVGQYLASASDDETVIIWDMTTGTPVHTLTHTNWVLSVAFSPDGRLVASASIDEDIQIWNAATGEELQVLKGHTDWIRCLRFSPDGKYLVSASDDKTARLWEISTGFLLQTFHGHKGQVLFATFSLDGSLVASSSDDKTVRLWDTVTGNELQKFKDQKAKVAVVDFLSNGKMLVSTLKDKTIQLWEAPTGLPPANGSSQGLLDPRNRSGSRLSLTSKRSSGLKDLTFGLWDSITAAGRQILRGHTGEVNYAAFSPDGTILATGSADETVRLWGRQ